MPSIHGWYTALTVLNYLDNIWDEKGVILYSKIIV